MQLEPGASAAGQLLTCVKDEAPVPLSVIEVRFNGAAEPVLARVMVCTGPMLPEETAPKASVVEESERVGALTPLPLRVTDCVGVVPLSEKTREAERLPSAVGAKRSSTMQLAAAASELGQLFICVKDVEFVPLSTMKEKVSGALPVLVSVTVWAGL